MATSRQGPQQKRHLDANCDLPGFYYDCSRKRYFKINGNAHHSSYDSVRSIAAPTATTVTKDVITPNIMKLVRLQECGQFPVSQFSAKIKVSKFAKAEQRRISVASSLKVNGRITSCLSLMAGNRGEYIAGVWTVENRRGLKPEVVVGSYKVNHFDADSKAIQLEPSGFLTPFVQGKVVDSCWGTDSDVHRTVLMCTVNDNASQGVFVSLPNDTPNLPNGTTRIYLSKDAVFCCTFHQNGHKAAFGMEKFGLLCDMNRGEMVRLYSDHDSVYCLKFHPNGQIGFSGTKKGNIYCWDLRDHPSKKFHLRIHASKLAVIHLDVLTNENCLISSSFGNQLQKIDLRSRKLVLDYKEHVNDHLKIPFSIEECMNLICSPGQDDCIRLWDIDSGKLIKSIESSTSFSKDTPKALFRALWQGDYSNPCVIASSADHILTYSF